MTHSSRAYVVVPVIYLGVILGLLFLQFSGGERFTRSVGPLTLHATRGTSGEDGSPQVREVSLEFDGLSFGFVEERGLIVETTDNVTDLHVIGYQMRDDGVELTFQDDYALSFRVSTDSSPELQLRLELPDEPGELRKVSVPFRLTGAPSDTRTATPSFVTVTLDGREYYFTAPPNAEIDLPNGKIVLEPEAAGQAIRFVEAREGDPVRVVGWFEDDAMQIGDAEYQTTLSAYVDLAYLGWSDGRLNARNLTWTGAAGIESFSEEALTAYLAEAWTRNEYERAFAEMRRAVDLHPDELSLLSAPFLGDLREIRERYLEADRIRSELIQEQIESRDPTLFRQEGLFRFAADRAGEEVYTRLLDFADEVELRRLDLASAIGLLRNLYLDPLPDERAESAALRAVDLIQLTVLRAIVRTDVGFFVQSSPGQIDLELTVMAGAVLDAYGATRGDRVMRTVGRNLVTSVLTQADANGMVPATLIVRGESVEASDGMVVPEKLYPVLADAPAYPRQVSLYDQAGSGHWIWTVVPVSPVRVTDSEWRFELTYPRLRTFFLVFQGIPSFDRMELFGQTWRDAPDFEIYSKGRYYNEESDTLMIKYYDDSVRREVAVFF